MPEKEWAELPTELLGLVLQKLVLPDHARLSCACKSWNRAVKEKAWTPKPDSPWLMLPGKDNISAKFLSFSENRTYSIPLPLPEIRRRVCIGSSHGWLITVYDMSEMHLLNPVTGVQIRLPSITTLPYVCEFVDACRRLFIYKAILSSPPSADGTGDFTVILLHNPFRLHEDDFSNMAITRVGDNTWTPLSPGSHDSIADIIHHKGRLYGVDIGGHLHTWDHHRLSYGPKSTLKIQYYCGMSKLLVESVNGELFMLHRDLGHKTFEVIRLDLDKPEFIPVNDLSDDVFFVGLNTSFAVSATRFPELRGNCIYFTDDYYFDFDNLENEPRDMGVFYVKVPSTEPIPNLGAHSNWPPPIWITPTLL